MINQKLLLTVREVAALTGFSEGTLRHWISEMRVPVVRISARCVRFRQADIENWLAEKLVTPSGIGGARSNKRAKGDFGRK